MPYIALLVLLAIQIAAAPNAAAEARQVADVSAPLRIGYADGMKQMLYPMCEVACAAEPEGCMAKCMAPDLMTAAAEAGGDEAICDARGGMVRQRMPACQEALGGLLQLHDDSSVEAGLQVVADIYRSCSVHVLCAANDAA